VTKSGNGSEQRVVIVGCCLMTVCKATAVWPISATAFVLVAMPAAIAVRSTCLSYPPASSTIGSANAFNATSVDSGVVASESL